MLNHSLLILVVQGGTSQKLHTSSVNMHLGAYVEWTTGNFGFGLMSTDPFVTTQFKLSSSLTLACHFDLVFKLVWDFNHILVRYLEWFESCQSCWQRDTRCMLLKTPKLSLHEWQFTFTFCTQLCNLRFSGGYRGGSPTDVQAWWTCPLWEPSPSHPILV